MILLAALVLFYLIGGLPGVAGAVFGLIGSIIEAIDKGISYVVERVQKHNDE